MLSGQTTLLLAIAKLELGLASLVWIKVLV
jgi:hypothetical protein